VASQAEKNSKLIDAPGALDPESDLAQEHKDDI